MKMRLWSLLLVTMLVGMAMTGCRMMESAGRAVENGVEAAEDSLKQSMGTTTAPEATRTSNPVLTQEEAQRIALEHAGLTAGQVTALHTEYETEHGTPIYDVEFRHGNWEYDYEIHADTGEILSFSKDDGVTDAKFDMG